MKHVIIKNSEKIMLKKCPRSADICIKARACRISVSEQLSVEEYRKLLISMVEYFGLN